MINHRSNCLIGKNGCYHIPLYRRPTIDNNSPPNTAYKFHCIVLSKEQLLSNQSKGAELESHSKDSWGAESSPPFPPDYLVLRMLVLRMSDCPSSTLTAQPESR
ncbi:hypothetical protein AMTRI_Chr10g2950 [Amborella trichopoda]